MKKYLLILFIFTCLKLHAQEDTIISDTSFYSMRLMFTQSENGDSVHVSCKNCMVKVFYTKGTKPIMYFTPYKQSIIDTTIKK